MRTARGFSGPTWADLGSFGHALPRLNPFNPIEPLESALVRCRFAARTYAMYALSIWMLRAGISGILSAARTASRPGLDPFEARTRWIDTDVAYSSDFFGSRCSKNCAAVASRLAHFSGAWMRARLV